MSVVPTDLARTLIRRATARRDADEHERDRCRREFARVIPICRRDLGVERVWLIGSLAWGGFGLRSDIDVVVENAGPEVMNAVAERIGEATGRAVDVLALEALPPSFRKRVLADGVHVA